MSKPSEFKNRDRFIQIGITRNTVAFARLISERLAEKANISRSFLSAVEAPKIVRPFLLEILFNIADALDVKPETLISASMLPDDVFEK